MLLNHSSNYILRAIIIFFSVGMEWRLDIYNEFNRSTNLIIFFLSRLEGYKRGQIIRV